MQKGWKAFGIGRFDLRKFGMVFIIRTAVARREVIVFLIYQASRHHQNTFFFQRSFSSFFNLNSKNIQFKTKQCFYSKMVHQILQIFLYVISALLFFQLFFSCVQISLFYYFFNFSFYFFTTITNRPSPPLYIKAHQLQLSVQLSPIHYYIM